MKGEQKCFFKFSTLTSHLNPCVSFYFLFLRFFFWLLLCCKEKIAKKFYLSKKPWRSSKQINGLIREKQKTGIFTCTRPTWSTRIKKEMRKLGQLMTSSKQPLKGLRWRNYMFLTLLSPPTDFSRWKQSTDIYMLGPQTWRINIQFPSNLNNNKSPASQVLPPGKRMSPFFCQEWGHFFFVFFFIFVLLYFFIS